MSKSIKLFVIKYYSRVDLEYLAEVIHGEDVTGVKRVCLHVHILWDIWILCGLFL